MESQENNIFKILTLESGSRSSSTQQPLRPNPALIDGRILPKALQAKFSDSDAKHKPLEEIDTFYNDKQTFVVVSSQYRIHRFSSHNTMYLFAPLNDLRKFTIFLLTHWIFSVLMTAAVLTDSFLDAYFYYENDVNHWVYFKAFRYMFLCIYLVEFGLKLIARGLVMSPFSIIRSWSGWLDILVIFISILLAAPGNNQFQFCSVRMLKLIPYNPTLQLSKSFIVSCACELKEVIISTFVVVSLATVMGLQMYMGVLTQKCVMDQETVLTDSVDDFHKKWHNHASDRENWFTTDPEYDYPLCGNASGSGICPENYTCLQGFFPNPNYGLTSFDNFIYAAMNVVRLATQDYGEALYTQIHTAAGHFHELYFFLIFLFGTYGLGTFAFAVTGKCFLDMSREEDEDENLDNQRNPSRVWIQMLSKWNFSPTIESWRHKIHTIVFHPFAELAITSIIALDVLLMAFDKGDLSWNGISQAQLAPMFCSIYLIEFLVKLFANAPKEYLEQQFIDGMVAFLFIIHLIFNYNSDLRALLVIRVFKLMPRWPSLDFLRSVTFNSLKRYWSYFALLGIFVFMAALEAEIGYSISYRNKSEYLMPGGKISRWNFVGLEHSFMQIYRILAGEWIELLWDCFLIQGHVCNFYFYPVLLFTSLLMTIFAIIVIVTTKETLEKAASKDYVLYAKLNEGFERVCIPVIWIKTKFRPQAQTHDILDDLHDSNSQIDDIRGDPSPNKTDSRIDVIINNKYYRGISVAVILLSSFVLTLSDADTKLTAPNNNNTETIAESSSISIRHATIYYTDVAFTIYFLIDIGLKFICCLINQRMVTVAWSFDFVLILEMICNLILYSPSMNPLAGFMYLKCLRPFMIVSRIERLKVVIDGVVTEVALLGRYLMAGAFVWLAFDIQGMQLFQYQFKQCLVPENGTRAELISDKTDCHLNNFTWQGSSTNFDGVLNGIHVLLQLATVRGWIGIGNDVVDSRGIDQQPQREAHYYKWYYIVVFMIFGSFFLFHILIGVLATVLRGRKYQGIFMTTDQLVEYKSNLRNAEAVRCAPQQASKIPAPEYRVLRIFYDIVENHFFDKFIMSVIIFHLVVVSTDNYHVSEGWVNAIDTVQVIVIAIYFVEMVMKLLGWRQHYFKNVYNRWDFFIVLYLTTSLVASELIEKYLISPFAFQLIRFFRLFQFEPFKRRAIVTQKFLAAFSLFRPVFLNLMFFLFLTLFSYSLLFFAMFSHVKSRAALDDHFNNFHSIYLSFQFLLQLFLYGGWDGVYEGLSDDSDCYPNIDCGDPVKTPIVMLSFFTITVILVTNMYLLFVLEIINRLMEVDETAKEPTAVITEGNLSSATINAHSPALDERQQIMPADL